MPLYWDGPRFQCCCGDGALVVVGGESVFFSARVTIDFPRSVRRAGLCLTKPLPDCHQYIRKYWSALLRLSSPCINARVMHGSGWQWHSIISLKPLIWSFDGQQTYISMMWFFTIKATDFARVPCTVNWDDTSETGLCNRYIGILYGIAYANCLCEYVWQMVAK